MDISTSKYEWTHGRKPRGRGSWAFIIVDTSSETEVATIFSPGSMTYTAAKAWAKKAIKNDWSAELNTGFLRLVVGT